MDIENKIIRRFLRVVAALVFVAYAGYIIYRKLKYGSVNIDSTDVGILTSCVSILLAIEAVRYYVKSRFGNK